jgi:hypothetical protein
MIARFLIIGLSLLGASIGAAHANHVGNKAHTPVVGVELGERLTKSVVPAALASPQSKPVGIEPDVSTARAERKVRIVYPLPR